MAGTAVDVSLYPLDTIKTRLQASEGFLKAGGVKGVYQGLSVTVAGSAPGGAYIMFPCSFCVCVFVCRCVSDALAGCYRCYAPLRSLLSARLRELSIASSDRLTRSSGVRRVGSVVCKTTALKRYIFSRRHAGPRQFGGTFFVLSGLSERLSFAHIVAFVCGASTDHSGLGKHGGE